MDTTWIIIDLASFLTVAVLTGFLIPQILLIAFKKKLFDEPDERKIHTLPVPRLGGIAFMPVILFTIMLYIGFGLLYDYNWLKEIPIDQIKEGVFLACGGLALFIVGIADDLIGVRYRAKFTVQIGAAVLLVASDLIFNDFHGLFGLQNINIVFAIGLTILLIVFITNAINLIDGIDGLASGLSLIACLVYGIFCFDNFIFLFSQIAFCLFAALITFFSFNVFGDATKRKKIFMGDTGTLTVGIILSALALRLANEPDSNTHVDYNYGVVAFSPLLVPCLDVVRVYLHRIRNGSNPFLPDKNHIHHKLLAAGMHQRLAMITIISFSAAMSAINIWLSRYINITFIFLADVIIWIILNIWLTRRIRLRNTNPPR
ncbi:MAG: undecaprenyl/decaprenyl-phosphate alpha-N-acetylglucosaminyl 1-phosphate transferase [Muribaculaceae bacterium]|nr:undecaprenyl/decaprenyl-phosphate alpha-N-acetylglucosaminyl 1-phosphate transferase [Muribaculaceae bacterium]